MPELLSLMKDKDLDIPVVVGGSVITPGDGKRLTDMGVAAVLGPGAPKEDIIDAIKRVT